MAIKIKKRLVKNAEKEVTMFLKRMKEGYRPLKVVDLHVSENRLLTKLIYPQK